MGNSPSTPVVEAAPVATKLYAPLDTGLVLHKIAEYDESVKEMIYPHDMWDDNSILCVEGRNASIRTLYGKTIYHLQLDAPFDITHLHRRCPDGKADIGKQAICIVYGDSSRDYSKIIDLGKPIAEQSPETLDCSIQYFDIFDNSKKYSLCRDANQTERVGKIWNRNDIGRSDDYFGSHTLLSCKVIDGIAQFNGPCTTFPFRTLVGSPPKLLNVYNGVAAVSSGLLVRFFNEDKVVSSHIINIEALPESHRNNVNIIGAYRDEYILVSSQSTSNSIIQHNSVYLLDLKRMITTCLLSQPCHAVLINSSGTVLMYCVQHVIEWSYANHLHDEPNIETAMDHHHLTVVSKAAFVEDPE